MEIGAYLRLAGIMKQWQNVYCCLLFLVDLVHGQSNAISRAPRISLGPTENKIRKIVLVRPSSSNRSRSCLLTLDPYP